MGGFKDSREFSENKIQNWVNQWQKRDNILVEKVGKKLFLFFFEDAEDCLNLLNLCQLNFEGALLALKPWFFGATPGSVTAKESALWIRFEGLPFLYVRPAVVMRMASKLGHPLLVVIPDEEDKARPHLQAKVRINLTKPLAPGCYFEYEEGHLAWVNFRYEKVFRFCIKCGKKGHKTVACKKSLQSVEEDIMEVMKKMNEGDADIIFDDNDVPLYSNKIRGLAAISKYTTTIPNLLGLPQSPRISESSDDNGDEEDDMDDTSDSSQESGGSNDPDTSSEGRGCDNGFPTGRYGPTTFIMTAPCSQCNRCQGQLGNLLSKNHTNHEEEGTCAFNDVLMYEEDRGGDHSHVGPTYPIQITAPTFGNNLSPTPQSTEFSFHPTPPQIMDHISHPFELSALSTSKMGPLGEIFNQPNTSDIQMNEKEIPAQLHNSHNQHQNMLRVI